MQDQDTNTQSVAESLNLDSAFEKTHNKSCPNCGYCPHCGRSNNPYPYTYPYYPSYPNEWWQTPYRIYWDINTGSQNML